MRYLFNEAVDIPGLKYISNYISITHEDELLKLIDSQNWNLDLKRRTQHYGYKYNYTARVLDSSYYLGEMPCWLDELCNRLHLESVFTQKPDQVIINEYMQGQGIADHIDSSGCFTDIVCSLSMVSGCIMNLKNGNIKKNIYLEPRSLLILQGDARYKWKHGIVARKSNNGVKRLRRISLTFRKVIV